MRALAWLPACMLILGCSGQPAGAVEAQIRPSRDSAWGAYLGCFELRQITQSDPSLGAQVPRQYRPGRISYCTAHCKALNYSLVIITPDFNCRCAIAVPDAEALLDDAACGQAGVGAAVFYMHDLASTQSCRLASLPLSADSVDFHYNSYHASFYKDNTTDLDTMQLTMEGANGIRLAAKDSWQLYGQVEVTAMVDGTCGAVTAFYLRSSDEYTWDNKGDFDEIDFEFLNGHPAVKSCVWLNTFNGGMSGGEHMVRPHVYQAALGLTPTQTNSNTFIKYTIHWQPSRVTWAMNGVPILTRMTGEVVKWEDMMNKEFSKVFSSPDAASHISFSMWSDQSRYKFGGELAYEQSPYHSYFNSLKRIVCEGPGAKPLPPALEWLTTASLWPNALSKSSDTKNIAGNQPTSGKAAAVVRKGSTAAIAVQQTVGKSSNIGGTFAGQVVASGKAAEMVVRNPTAAAAAAGQQTLGKAGVIAAPMVAATASGKGLQPAAVGGGSTASGPPMSHPTAGKGEPVASKEAITAAGKDMQPATATQGETAGVEQVLLRKGKSPAAAELALSVSTDMKPMTINQHHVVAAHTKEVAASTGGTKTTAPHAISSQGPNKHKTWVNTPKHKGGSSPAPSTAGAKMQVDQVQKKSVQG